MQLLLHLVGDRSFTSFTVMAMILCGYPSFPVCIYPVPSEHFLWLAGAPHPAYIDSSVTLPFAPALIVPFNAINPLSCLVVGAFGYYAHLTSHWERRQPIPFSFSVSFCFTLPIQSGIAWEISCASLFCGPSLCRFQPRSYCSPKRGNVLNSCTFFH